MVQCFTRPLKFTTTSMSTIMVHGIMIRPALTVPVGAIAAQKRIILLKKAFILTIIHFRAVQRFLIRIFIPMGRKMRCHLKTMALYNIKHQICKTSIMFTKTTSCHIPLINRVKIRIKIRIVTRIKIRSTYTTLKTSTTTTRTTKQATTTTILKDQARCRSDQ